MDIEKSTIFTQLFGDVNTILYLCTQSIAPIKERRIPTCTPSVFGFGFRCSAIVAGRRAPNSSWVAQKPFLLDERWLELSPNVSDDSPKISPNLYRFLRKTPTLSENAS